MSFIQEEAEQLLADTGRRCCICGKLHDVSLHHIVPKNKGGTDKIDNAISLCPNCHNEIHKDYVTGQTTRAYTPNELKKHRQRTIDQVKKEREWKTGNKVWEEDKELILFYAQCLDRPAFHTYFNVEMSFSDFDKAMEDTLIALNTGYWRMRDGTLIDLSKGKSYLTHYEWKDKLDKIVEIIEDIRKRFHEAIGLNQSPFHSSRHRLDFEFEVERIFRNDREHSSWMDQKRQETIDIMNSILSEIGHPLLKGIV